MALSIGALAHAVQDGMTATIYVLLPILSQAFGFSYADVGAFKAVKGLTQAFLEMASGFLVERVGEIRTLVLGLALSGVGYLGLWGAPGAMAVLGCLVLIGAGTALHHAPSSALIIAAHPLERRRGALGLYNSSGDVGKLAFTGCFSLGIGAGLAWQQISFAYGAVALLTMFGLSLLLRQSPITPAADTEATPSDTNAGVGWGILNWSAFSILLTVVFIDTMVQAGILVFVAFVMLEKGLSLAVATTATVILLVGGVFGKAGCGYLAQHLGVRQSFTLIKVLTALGLVGVVLAPVPLALAILLPLGAVAQGSTSVTYGFAADLIHPTRMARGYALLYSSSSFSYAGGPILFGLIGDHVGLDAAVYAMAVCALLAIPPIWWRGFGGAAEASAN